MRFSTLYPCRRELLVAVALAGQSLRRPKKATVICPSRSKNRKPRGSCYRFGRFEQLEDRWLLSVFTVNSIGDEPDASPGDSIAETVAGQCTLRAAIQEANATLGADTIHFAIPGAGPHTIQPTSGLPKITDPVTIDGYTQAGASPNTNGPGLGINAVLMVELDGSNASGSGLRVSGGSSTIRGLVINRFGSGAGIRLESNGQNVIEGNFIGKEE